MKQIQVVVGSTPHPLEVEQDSTAASVLASLSLMKGFILYNSANLNERPFGPDDRIYDKVQNGDKLFAVLPANPPPHTSELEPSLNQTPAPENKVPAPDSKKL